MYASDVLGTLAADGEDLLSERPCRLVTRRQAGLACPRGEAAAEPVAAGVHALPQPWEATQRRTAACVGLRHAQPDRGTRVGLLAGARAAALQPCWMALPARCRACVRGGALQVTLSGASVSSWCCIGFSRA